jgi:hypothetical protein
MELLGKNMLILFSARDSKTKLQVISSISGNRFITTFQSELRHSFNSIGILITDLLLEDKLMITGKEIRNIRRSNLVYIADM